MTDLTARAYNLSKAPTRHTRVTLRTKPGRGKPNTSARPQTFPELWAWAVAQADTLSVQAPQEIHSRFGDREGWDGKSPEGRRVLLAGRAIRGLPFHPRFERYVMRERPFVKGTLSRAASHLYSRTGRQTDEFRIVYAIMSGHTDPEIVRIVILGSPHREYFEATAIRALAFCYERCHEQLAEAKDPDQKAGAA